MIFINKEHIEPLLFSQFIFIYLTKIISPSWNRHLHKYPYNKNLQILKKYFVSKMFVHKKEFKKKRINYLNLLYHLILKLVPEFCSSLHEYFVIIVNSLKYIKLPNLVAVLLIQFTFKMLIIFKLLTSTRAPIIFIYSQINSNFIQFPLIFNFLIVFIKIFLLHLLLIFS